MSRLEMLLESGAEVLRNEFSRNLNEVVENLDTAKLSVALQTAIDNAILSQHHEQKGIITYISFSALLSSILTQQYSFGINFYDEQFFVDAIDVFSEWNVKEIAPFIESDIEVVKKQLQKEFVGVCESELLEIKHQHALAYLLVCGHFLESKLAFVLKNLQLANLKTAQTVIVTLGLYMEKQTTIYRFEVGK